MDEKERRRPRKEAPPSESSEERLGDTASEVNDSGHSNSGVGGEPSGMDPGSAASFLDALGIPSRPVAAPPESEELSDA